jgi:hypothetical protein
MLSPPTTETRSGGSSSSIVQDDKENDDPRVQGSTEHVTVQAVQNVPIVQIVSEQFDHLERLTSLEFLMSLTTRPTTPKFPFTETMFSSQQSDITDRNWEIGWENVSGLTVRKDIRVVPPSHGLPQRLGQRAWKLPRASSEEKQRSEKSVLHLDRHLKQTRTTGAGRGRSG